MCVEAGFEQPVTVVGFRFGPPVACLSAPLQTLHPRFNVRGELPFLFSSVELCAIEDLVCMEYRLRR